MMKCLLLFKAKVKHKRNTSIASTVAGNEDHALGTPRSTPGLRNRRRSSGGSSALASVSEGGNLGRMKYTPTESRGGGLTNRLPLRKAPHSLQQNPSANTLAGRRAPLTNGEMESIGGSSSQLPGGDGKYSNDAGVQICNGGRGVGLPAMKEGGCIICYACSRRASKRYKGRVCSKHNA